MKKGSLFPDENGLLFELLPHVHTDYGLSKQLLRSSVQLKYSLHKFTVENKPPMRIFSAQGSAS